MTKWIALNTQDRKTDRNNYNLRIGQKRVCPGLIQMENKFHVFIIANENPKLFRGFKVN